MKLNFSYRTELDCFSSASELLVMVQFFLGSVQFRLAVQFSFWFFCPPLPPAIAPA